MVEMPPGFTPHPKIVRLLEQRAQMGKGERPIDWGMGELFAYASLLVGGTNVRMSGQDCARGTFSHRHAILTDVKTGREHNVLCNLHPDQGMARIYDSPLSEAGVLGFEFGYSLDYPDALVMWEAQFGDFANGAQVIIDQFITSSEDKWKRLSGLTLLLPHGYEGQGPEHSSARLERYLQSCAEHNIQVAQPTTPAQMYHLLRSQVLRKLRKPLIVMTPKSLLRSAGRDVDARRARDRHVPSRAARQRRRSGEGHARADVHGPDLLRPRRGAHEAQEPRTSRSCGSRSCIRGGRTWSARRSTSTRTSKR